MMIGSFRDAAGAHFDQAIATNSGAARRQSRQKFLHRVGLNAV
jgi:hypothetical protein